MRIIVGVLFFIVGFAVFATNTSAIIAVFVNLFESFGSGSGFSFPAFALAINAVFEILYPSMIIVLLSTLLLAKRQK